jgi:hypothetical protein
MPDTTGFQWVFDHAEQLGLQRRHVVAQSVTRSGVVRSVSRGAQPKKFTVTLPNGMPWKDCSTYIAQLDAADRFTVGNVTINNAGHSWMGGNSVGGIYGNSYSLICTSMPTWYMHGSRQVSWSGPFEFVEYVA